MKKYRLLLLSFVFFGTLLSSFHHHNDGMIDDNCPICLVQNNFNSSADVIAIPLEIPKIVYEQIVINNKQIYTYDLISNTLSRAPPKIS